MKQLLWIPNCTILMLWVKFLHLTCGSLRRKCFTGFTRMCATSFPFRLNISITAFTHQLWHLHGNSTVSSVVQNRGAMTSKQDAGKKQGDRMHLPYQIDTKQTGGWSITRKMCLYKISFFHLILIYFPVLFSVPSQYIYIYIYILIYLLTYSLHGVEYFLRS